MFHTYCKILGGSAYFWFLYLARARQCVPKQCRQSIWRSEFMWPTLGIMPLLHGTVSRMYDVFMVIVYILRLFFILYGNTTSYLETDDFLIICSCLERYILEICTDFLEFPFTMMTLY